MLGERVVDGDDRIFQSSILGHRAQTDNAGSGLFRAGDDAVNDVLALGESGADQIGAVIHGDVRLVVERGKNVLVVRIVVFALDGKDTDAVVAHKRSGHVVLRRKRV